MWSAVVGAVIAFFLAFFLSVAYTWIVGIAGALGLINKDISIYSHRQFDLSLSLLLIALAMGIGAWMGYAHSRQWNPYTPWRYILPSQRRE